MFVTTVTNDRNEGDKIMNEKRTMYLDTMDNSRVVEPLRQEGKHFICGIYLRNNNQLDYVGQAPISMALFTDPKTVPINARIGYVPYRSQV